MGSEMCIRDRCRLLAKQIEPLDISNITITFYPPDRRRRDLDNCYFMLKSAIDGMCLAWGVDDSEIKRVTLQWGNVVKGGEVKIKSET